MRNSLDPSSKTAPANQFLLSQKKDLAAVLRARNTLIVSRKHEYGDEKHMTEEEIDEKVEEWVNDSSAMQRRVSGVGNELFNTSSRGSILGNIHEDEEVGKILLIVDSTNPRTKGFQYKSKSLFFMTVNNSLRRAVIRLVDNIWFDNFILFVILLNCLCLAFDNPIDTPSGTEAFLTIAEYIFTSLFAVEAILKIIAMGFILNGNTSYLADGWNRLDFIVVIAAFIPYIFNIPQNVTAIRAIRLLRPLRTISTLPGLRLLVNSMFGALPLLADVFILLSFIFFLFGICGMQLFGGTLRQRCLDDITHNVVENITSLCRMEKSGPFTCPTGSYCGDSHVNINRDVSGFDNILQAWVTIITCSSLEGWVDVTYATWEAVSYWSSIYFILLTMLIAFFLLQLITGVVYTAYATAEEEERVKSVEFELSELIDAQEKRIRAERKTDIKHSESESTLKTGNKLEVQISDLKKVDDDTQEQKPKAEENISLCSKERIKGVVLDDLFEHFIVGCIVLNTISLCIEHHGQPDAVTIFLLVSNILFTIIFTLEAMLKVYGLGFKEYWKDGFNKFDIIVVFFSWVDIILTSANFSQTGMSAFRVFRLLRVFKLAKRFPSLQKLINTVVATINQVSYFTLLLVIFMYVFALLGMQLYAGNLYDEDGEVLRSNFDSFWWAVLSVFQIIGGENWNDILVAGVASNDWGAAVYFVVLFVLGNYIVLNLFLAILLSNFDDEEEEKDDNTKLMEQVEGKNKAGQPKPKKKKKRRFFRAANKNASTLKSKIVSAPALLGRFGRRAKKTEETKTETKEEIKKIESKHIKTTDTGNVRIGDVEVMDANICENPDLQIHGKVKMIKNDNNDDITATDGIDVELKEITNNGDDKEDKEVDVVVFASEEVKYWVQPITGTSLIFQWKPENPIRAFFGKIANSFALECFIMIFIFLSILFLCMDAPDMRDNQSLQIFLFYSSIVTTIAFSLESVIKIIAFGFFFGDTAYLSEWWNVLDFAIVLVSIFDLFSSGISFVKAFRTLRSLRPLRVVSRNESLMVVIQSIFRAIPAMLNVFLLAFLVLVVFGILGVNLFAGLFFRCETIDGDAAMQFLYDKSACDSMPDMVWKNPDVGDFDNIYSSILTLFEVSTMEMWPELLYRAVDISELDAAPIRDNALYYSIFFVIYIIIGNFFVGNLFVGMIVDTFSKMKNIVEGSALLTKKQQIWLDIYRLMSHTTADAPINVPREQPIRKSVYNVVSDERFDYFISGCICLNVVAMSLWYYDMSDTYAQVLMIINLCFSAIFTLEAIFKIFALRDMYFANKWNVFDFLIVLGSIVDIIFLSIYGPTSTIDFTIFRVFRLLRMVRLINRNPGLKKLIEASFLAANALVNVGGLMLLLFTIYALAGMGLFGDLTKREFLNEHTNFDNFGIAMFTLFRMATGESWNGIMHDCLPRTDCDRSIVGDCGSVMAVPYFVSFIFLGQFLMLNLFIAVLLDEFVGIGEKEDDDAIQALQMSDLNEYSTLWAKYSDPQPFYTYLFDTVVGNDKNEFLSWAKFQLLMQDLTGGLAFVEKSPSKSIAVTHAPMLRREKSFTKLNNAVLKETPQIPLKVMPDKNGKSELYVHYIDGLMALAHRAFCNNAQEAEGSRDFVSKEMEHFPDSIVRLRILQNKMLSKFKGKKGTNISLKETEATPLEENNFTLSQVIAAQRIQAVFRGKKVREKLTAQMLLEDEALAKIDEEAEDVNDVEEE